FTNLNNDKQETAPRLNVATTIDVAADKLTFYDASHEVERAILPESILPFVERTVIMKCVADTIAPVTGDGITHFTIPSTLDGKNLFSAQAHVYTAGTASSITNVQIHNTGTGYDMLSTPITIDLNETDSSTAATPPVIGGQNDVSTGDVIRIDIDAVATDTKGLEIRMVFST
ncbi:MAG: hypothetical protein QF535_08585, partial [Anaerolineales bacterium]|nr:hypothetical protein [Anaerolineales bacterium]